DPQNSFGFQSALARDAAGEFPERMRGAVAELAALHVAFVPADEGGPGTAFDDTMMQVRVAARRDVAVMPAAMFSITATTCILLAGTDEQKKHVLAILESGGAVAFALSEPDHGADVLAGDCRFEDGTITGRKWMVGLGSRCEAAYVVVRTGGRGPAAFSGILLGSDDLAKSRDPNPLPCTGLRGIDFATLCFNGHPVTESQRVGEPGHGLVAALRALQIVRVTGTAANLSCTDTALRVTVAHAFQRRVGPLLLAEHRRPRADLGAAFAWHFAADVAAITAGRAIHVCPQSLSHWSSIVKRVATEATSEILARCADTLGTWSVVREGPGAIFDKVRRDADTLRYVDTGPEATLRTLSAQLPSLLKTAALTAEASANVDTILDLHAPLPAYQPHRLELFSRGPDDIITAFETRYDDLTDTVPPETKTLVAEIKTLLNDLRDQIASPGVDLVDCAATFSVLHTAACCVLLWAANRRTGLYGGNESATGWLDGALAVTIAAAAGRQTTLTAKQADGVLEHGWRLLAAHHLLTALPVQLAGHGLNAPQGDNR
ncbi:MAG TPA: acyl-CoA dehydrogenase family protein, partial [Rariglobus sp.]